jgi:hypothetical protein
MGLGVNPRSLLSFDRPRHDFRATFDSLCGAILAREHPVIRAGRRGVGVCVSDKTDFRIYRQRFAAA